MKILRYIIIAILWLGTEQITIAQYYLKSKSDSTDLESDSVFLFIDECRGTINWQASTDLNNWFSLNKHDDTLAVRIDKSGYYRATIVEGTCYPVISDTVFLIEKLTLTGSNQFTVDTMGGVFLLPSGIKVKIPRGAVTGPKEMRVGTISIDSVNTLATVDMPEYKSFLSGVSVATDTFNFSKPIKIKIPLPDTDGLSWLYELNKDTKDWLLSDEVILVGNQYMNIDKNESFVEIIFNKSEQKSNDTKKGLQFSLNDIRSFFLVKYGDIFLAEDPCRQGIHKIESGDMDKGNSGGCTLVHADMVVRYTDCKPEQVGQYVALSLSADCKPSLICPGSLKIKKGESVPILITTEFSGFATIGSFPLSQQNITLSPTASVSVKPSSQSTDDQGHASFSVTGNIPGDGEIKVTANFKYFLNTLLTNDNGKMEYEEYDPVPEFAKECTIDVKVIDVPEVSTASATDINCTSVTVGGNVISDNNSEITSRGVLFDGDIITAGSGPGAFSTTLSNLEYNKVYSVQAFAVNEAGMGYGDPVYFTVPECCKAVVRVFPQSLTLVEGDKFQLRISYGENPDFIPQLSFSSSNTQIVSIDFPGVITAHKVGNATVSISWCDNNFSIDIPIKIISECDAINVIITPQNLTIQKKEHYPLDITYETISDGSYFIPHISWKSNNEAIATVTDLGVVYGISVGNATIEAKWCDTTVNIPVTVEGDRYIINWKATVNEHKVEDFQVTQSVSGTRTTTYEGLWEGSAEFVERGGYGGFQVINLTTTGYFKSYLLNVGRSDCGNEIRISSVLQESMTSIIPNDIYKLNYIYPKLEFVNNQCYFRDPFIPVNILVNYSVHCHSWGQMCSQEEPSEHEWNTENVINGFNSFDKPGNIFATSDECNNFYTKVDILKSITNYPIHWEVSIVAVEPVK